jgi:hypothetical protein
MNKKIKKILTFFLSFNFVIFIFLGVYFLKIKTDPLSIAIFLLGPGIYAIAYLIIYKELNWKGSTYRGMKAVIMCIPYFSLFLFLGLPIMLSYFGVPKIYDFMTSGWILLWLLIIGISPFILISLVDKIDKKPVNKTDYWIQSTDYNVTDGDALSLKEAQEFVKNFSWQKEIFSYNSLDKSKKKPCPPGIGFNSDGKVLRITSIDKGIFDVYLDTGNENRTAKGLALTQVNKFLEFYYKKDYESIFRY